MGLLGTLQRNQPLAPVDKKIGNNIGRFPDLLAIFGRPHENGSTVFLRHDCLQSQETR